MSSNVPKFASFRPKPKVEPEPPKEPQQHEKVGKSSKEKAPGRRRSPSPDRSTREQKSNKDRPYFSDRRGLSANQKIDRAESTDKKIVVTPATRRRQERLLTDKRANNEPVDPDTQYESDPELVIDTEITRKNSQLARQTKEHPTDVQGWLALIKHQEAMLKLERPSAELTASDKAHLADVRISTYEEALKKIGLDKNSQLRLYQGLLKEAERAWDGAKLAGKWKDVLAKHPQSVDLWMMYLDFVQSRFTSFKYEEASESANARLRRCYDTPGRASDDVAEDDAFHTIFFSDIEPYLAIVTPETPATLMIEAFLCFCMLPPLAHRIPQQRAWWSDPFLQREWHSATLDTDESHDFTKAVKRYSNYSAKSFQMTTELLFEQHFSLDGIKLDADFIRRLLKLLSSDPSSEDIVGEYLLAFESKHFPSEAFKTAKRLLKARPSSLRLYNAYGLVESRLGNSSKADQVFSMALSMQKGDDLLSAPWSLELFSNWVSEALRRGDHEEASWRLVSPEGKLPNAEHRNSSPWAQPAYRKSVKSKNMHY
ncbi:unnamed protein product [Alternaria alternata]